MSSRGDPQGLAQRWDPPCESVRHLDPSCTIIEVLRMRIGRSPERLIPGSIHPLLQQVTHLPAPLHEVPLRAGVAAHHGHRFRHPDAQVPGDKVPVAVAALDDAAHLGGHVLVVGAAATRPPGPERARPARRGRRSPPGFPRWENRDCTLLQALRSLSLQIHHRDLHLTIGLHRSRHR